MRARLSHFSALTAAAAFALALAAPVALRAQEQQKEKAGLSEKIGEELTKNFKPLLDDKNWDGAVLLLDRLSATAPADSYDLAYLTNTKAKIYLQKGDYAKAIEPMETSIRLSDRHQFFDEKETNDFVHYLAQIYYQEATTTKSPALIQQYFSKALANIKRYQSHLKKPDADATIFQASVVYNMAVSNPDKIDLGLVKQTRDLCQQGLLLSTKPKEGFYQLLLAAHQQLGDYVSAAELLELTVKQSPAKKDNWQQLMGLYLNLALDKDEKKAREWSVRAINTIERAQTFGHLKTPKDNYNLVGIYFNVGQFGKATELLYAGLKSGAIDSEQKNWELLAYSYQQIDKEFQAIDTYKEAMTQFPKSGQLDFACAQIYYQMDKPLDAYRHAVSALAKGNLERPGAVNGFLAYVCFELKKVDEALAAINRAIDAPDAKKDTQLPRLKTAIEDSIREREAAKGEVETAKIPAAKK